MGLFLRSYLQTVQLNSKVSFPLTLLSVEKQNGGMSFISVLNS
jgi:hypothetical protein